jgi:hypothetical protein
MAATRRIRSATSCSATSCQRIGHGGSDPGVRTEMLSDLAKEVGVILIVNTSLSGEQQRAYGAIFDALWQHGEALRASRR